MCGYGVREAVIIRYPQIWWPQVWWGLRLVSFTRPAAICPQFAGDLSSDNALLDQGIRGWRDARAES